MSKRNITYIKPEEPSFLRKIKEQVGYKEGPTVDTKREDLGPVDEDNLSDTQDEQPTVVVLNPGDLTAEEAAKVREEQEKEENEKPADLSLPITFKPRSKGETLENPDTSEIKHSKRAHSSKDKGNSKKAKTRAVLSFDEAEEDD